MQQVMIEPMCTAVDPVDYGWCYGRNGGFHPRELEVSFIAGTNLRIDVYSRRRGHTPPVRLEVTIETWRKLREAIEKEVNYG